MDIRNFITFNTIVETGGFTKAAISLSYAQSTVTLHIKELEKHYKSKLFDRIGKKIMLTTLGSQVYKISKVLVEDYNGVLELHLKHQSVQVLRIGVYESLLKYRLHNLIHDFKKSHPNVDMIIQHGTCKSLREMVRNGQLDLTFQIEPIREFSDMKVKVLCPEEFKLILPKDEPLDLIYHKDQTVYLTEKDCSYRTMFERYLDKKGVHRQHIMETGSIDMIKQYVGLSLGYSMVPAIALNNDLENENLEIYGVEWDLDLFTQVVYHKDKFVFPAMDEFIEMVILYSKGWSC